MIPTISYPKIPVGGDGHTTGVPELLVASTPFTNFTHIPAIENDIDHFVGVSVVCFNTAKAQSLPALALRMLIPANL